MRSPWFALNKSSTIDIGHLAIYLGEILYPLWNTHLSLSRRTLPRESHLIHTNTVDTTPKVLLHFLMGSLYKLHVDRYPVPLPSHPWIYLRSAHLDRNKQTIILNDGKNSNL